MSSSTVVTFVGPYNCQASVRTPEQKIVATCRNEHGAKRALVAAAIAMLAVVWAVPVLAETAAAFCRRVGADDTTKPIPAYLVPAVNSAFGIRVPAREAVGTTVFRCDSGRIMVCTTGANIPCTKANVNRVPTVGMVQWCKENPDARLIPAVASGHDTIYEWRCRNGAPQIGLQTLGVDARGFIARFWKALP